MNKGKVTARMLLDVSTAFDTIDHLIHHFDRCFEIKGIAGNWIVLYLNDRY